MRVITLFLSSLFLFFSCNTPSVTTQFQGYAMTMPYRVVIGKKLTNKEKRRLNQTITNSFHTTHEVFNNWNSNSEISQINQSRSTENIPLSKTLSKLLYLCEECVSLTQGRFDPTIGSILSDWRQSLQKRTLPKKIQEKAVGWKNLSLHPDTLKKNHPKCRLDLCAIAKGYTLDLLSAYLKDLGYENFFLEWGGEILARGTHPNKRKWKVSINTLNSPTLDICNQSIATSGNFMPYKWQYKKKEYFHIFDPKTKKPLEVAPSFTSVTVVAPSCYLADALATASMTCANLSDFRSWAQKIIKKNPDIHFYIYQDKEKKLYTFSQDGLSLYTNTLND